MAAVGADAANAGNGSGEGSGNGTDNCRRTGSVQPPRRMRWWTVTALGLLAVLLAGLWWTRPPPMPEFADVRKAWRPSEAWLFDRNGALIDSVRVDFRARRAAWTPLRDINGAVPAAVIRTEDRRFRMHSGVDWLAIGAAARARVSGDKSRGASTITMQLAAFLAPELAEPGQRGWIQKLRQMRAAMALGDDWSRDEVMEAYLNLVPLRGETQGIGAGAAALFGKKPAQMSDGDARLFAALLPNPGASAGALAARACRSANPARCEALTAGAATLTSGERAAQIDPGLAPHLSVRLLTKAGDRVTTSIDADIQRVAIRSMRRQLEALGSDRVRDGAVVVVDNASGDVLAYVGGVGLKSTAAAVDGANARRQAGSTLKPHLFAHVIERGWLTSASILDDSPVQLDTASGLYVPKNYDRSFRGPVSVRAALAGSLNVPAVRALVLGDVQDFRDRLWDLGYHGIIEDGDYYGFSLALGSAEVSLTEQANAFRTIANNGRLTPLRYGADPPEGAARQVLSPGAAFITADIMADAAARADSFGVDSALRLPFWAAVKTGTSKAMRDNWCIGFSDRFTVAVWVGNLEGDSMRSVSGTAGAAPVWRDIMLALHAGRPSKPPSMPAGVEARMISLPGTREPPRREYFLRGTGQVAMASVPASARRPRIASPANGSIYALDPDIPGDRQRLAIRVSGAAAGHRLMLGKQVIGDAEVGADIVPRPGSHLVALVDPGGRVIDRIRFTVR